MWCGALARVPPSTTDDLLVSVIDLFVDTNTQGGRNQVFTNQKDLLMKYLLVLFYGALFCSTLHAQVGDMTPHETYPVLNKPENDLQRRFMETFTPGKVGNLHVYTYRTTPLGNYYFVGKPLAINFAELYPSKLRRQMSGGKAYAVAMIRGGEGQHFIVRSEVPGDANRIGLYEFRGDKLVEVMPLAMVSCQSSGKCRQMDSWIQDVDGDTRLDIIQRTRTLRNGQESKVKTVVYRQLPDGDYTKKNALEIDPLDYQFKAIR